MQTYRFIGQLLVIIWNTLKELLKLCIFVQNICLFTIFSLFYFFFFFVFCHFTNILHGTKEKSNGTNKNSQGFLSDLILPSGKEFNFSCGLKINKYMSVYIYIFLIYHFLRGNSYESMIGSPGTWPAMCCGKMEDIFLSEWLLNKWMQWKKRPFLFLLHYLCSSTPPSFLTSS